MTSQDNWITRGYDNLQIANLWTSQLVDWTACRLVKSQPGKLAVDAGNRK